VCCDRIRKLQLAWVFNKPVDTSQFPDYTRYVSQPMDFGTISQKILDGAYREPAEVRFWRENAITRS